MSMTINPGRDRFSSPRQPNWVGDAIAESGRRLLDRGLEEIEDRIFGGGGGSEPPQGTPLVPGDIPGGDSCPDGFRRMPLIGCVRMSPADVLPGGAPFIQRQTPMGTPTMGHFGVAVAPMAEQNIRLKCPRGMVLGADDLCYNRNALRRSERKWIPGRKPLLTGGEMNAIRTAGRAAGKLQRSRKTLRKVSRVMGKAC